jgi:hypothetical protein
MVEMSRAKERSPRIFWLGPLFSGIMAQFWRMVLASAPDDAASGEESSGRAARRNGEIQKRPSGRQGGCGRKEGRRRHGFLDILGAGARFCQIEHVLFQLCRRTQQLSLIFRLVGGLPFGLWPLFLLRDGKKWTEMTATQYVETLGH